MCGREHHIETLDLMDHPEKLGELLERANADPGRDGVVSQHSVPDRPTFDREALATSTVDRCPTECLDPRDDRGRLSQQFVRSWTPDRQGEGLPRLTSGIRLL